MSGLSTATYQEIRGALLECGPIGTDQELRAVFSHPRLRPWRNRVPQSYSPTGRVDAVIDFLHNKANTDGANALVLFLTVLGDNMQQDGATECQQRLLEAAAAMAAETGTKLPQEAVQQVAARAEKVGTGAAPVQQIGNNIIVQGGTAIIFQGRGGETSHIGDIVIGDKKMGDGINISGGDFRGANVNIASKLENVTQTINTMPHGDDRQRDELKQLVAQLQEALAQVPSETADDVAKVTKRVEALVEEADDDNPDTEMMEITGESLKRAAENVKDALPAVLPIATQIVAHVLSMVR